MTDTRQITTREQVDRLLQELSQRAQGTLGVAARNLEDDGLVVLERNWRCDIGEIDIVAREGDVLVVCEVKTRSSLRHGSPFEAITERKLHRLERLGRALAQAQEGRERLVRIRGEGEAGVEVRPVELVEPAPGLAELGESERADRVECFGAVERDQRDMAADFERDVDEPGGSHLPSSSLQWWTGSSSDEAW